MGKFVRVPIAQGKEGKWPEKNPWQGKHREFGNFAKTQKLLFAHLVNSLILKIQHIPIFAKLPNFFLEFCI